MLTSFRCLHVHQSLENDRGNPGVEKGLPLPLPPQNPYPRGGRGYPSPGVRVDRGSGGRGYPGGFV
jgi:hypothetical protein